MIKRSMWAYVIGVGVLFAGCSSVRVQKLNPKEPDGIPFYLTKQKVMVTTTTLQVRSLLHPEAPPVATSVSVNRELIEVMDRSQAYTLNKNRPFAGSSKFSMERAGANSTLNKVSEEDTEGLTDFLKGISEGAKTLADAAKTGKEAFLAAPVAPVQISDKIQDALIKNGFYLDQKVEVTFEDLD